MYMYCINEAAQVSYLEASIINTWFDDDSRRLRDALAEGVVRDALVVARVVEARLAYS